MNLYPVNFLVMPHTHETKEMIEKLVFDNETLIGHYNYLSAIPTVAVVDSGEFCGFFTKEETDGFMEIHLFIYPSKRRVVWPLLKELKREAVSTHKGIRTSVHSTHQYLVKILERFGGKVTGVDEEFATKDGKLIGITYLEYKGE